MSQTSENRSSKTRQPSTRRRFNGGGVEPLESRIAPAVIGTISATLVGGELTVSDAADLANDFTVKLVNGGADLEITDSVQYFDGSSGIGSISNGGHTLTVPVSSVTGAITFNTAGENDTLTLDLSGGDFINAAGLDFNGGNQVGAPGDKLVIVGGAQGTVTYNFTNTNDGSVVMSNFGTVRYAGLEPVTNSGTATDVIINLPAGNDLAVIEDNGATSTDGMLRLRSTNAGFATTDFAIPSNLLTVNLGAGNDTLTVSATPQLTSGLTINGGQGDDTINLNSAITFAANKNLNIDLQDDDATPGIDLITSSSAANVVLSGTGAAVLKASRNIQLAGRLATENGNITLEANQQSAATAGNFVGVNVLGTSVTENTGTGHINILGRGGNEAAGAQYGFRTNTGALVRGGTTGDAVTITGTGGATSGNGIFIPNGAVRSLGGNILFTGIGTGTAGTGITIQNSGVVSPAAGGNVVLDATVAPDTLVHAFNLFTIATNPTGAFTSGGGSITVIADTMGLGTTGTGPSFLDAGTGTVTLRPKTTGQPIILGTSFTTPSAAGLEFSDAELDRVVAGTLQIGDSNSGAITVTNVISPLSYKTLSIGKAVSFVVDSNFGTIGGFDADAFSATDYEKIVAAGAVTINPAATLTVTAQGGFAPSLADSFTIIQNTSVNPTTGTFAGKAEGLDVTVGGVNKRLTYVGGAGSNDIMLVGEFVDLTLSKENTGNDDEVETGELVTYTLNYANEGTKPVSGLFIRDTAPAGAAITTASLNAGWFLESPGVYRLDIPGTLAASANGSAQIEYTVNDPAAAGQATIFSTATIFEDGASGADFNVSNNTATDTDTLNAAPDLAILSLENVGNDDTLTPGATVAYTINFGNNGNQDATGVVLTETLPAGATFNAGASTAGWTEAIPNSDIFTLTIGNLASGATGSAIFAVTIIDPAAAGRATIVNSATISDDDTNGADPSENDSATDVDNLDAAPDLAIISHSNGVNTAEAGSALTYTIAYANNGNQDATGVILSNELPTGTSFDPLENPGWALDGTTLTFEIGSLEAGALHSATLILHVDSPLAAGITGIYSTVSINDDEGNGADPDTDNNSDTLVTTTLVPSVVTISLDGKTARFSDVDGDLVTVKVTVGKLEQSNFIVNNLGFAELDLTNFGTDGLSFAGGRVSITAKRTAAGGDGLVNLGYLNATGMDLIGVTVNGNLGRIDVGDATPSTPALTALTAHSMGALDTSIEIEAEVPSPNLASTIYGGITTLTVRGNVRDVCWTIAGGTSADVGRILVGGSMEDAVLTLDGALRYLSVSGSLVDSDIAVSESIGTITAGLRPDTYKLNGGISVKGSIIDSIITTDGILSSLRTGGSYVNSTKSSGSLVHSTIGVRGNLGPVTAFDAQTVGLISISGTVDHSEILVGYDQEGNAVNPDVQVGKLLVGLDWLHSDLAIGVEAGEDWEFTTNDDALIAGGNPAIASSLGIGSIRGHFVGDVDSTENSGVTAETIGKLWIGNAKKTPVTGANGLMAVGVAHLSSTASGDPIMPTISATGSYATFVDVDGDIVRVQATAGTLTNANFLIVPMTGAVTGGGQLAMLDLTAGTGFAGASIVISAKPGPLGGNGMVNVGHLNAAGIDLLNVTVKGDLGQIDAGDTNETTPGIGNFIAQSMGAFGLATQPTLTEASLESSIVGAAATWRVGGDMVDTDLSVSGNVGKFIVGGSILFSDMSFGGTVNLASIRGDMLGSRFISEGSIGSILTSTTPGGYKYTGGWTVAGDVIVSELAVNGDVSRIGVGGSLFYSNIRVRGDVLGATDELAAQTIGSITVRGGVELSYIEVGRDIEGLSVNGDVQVGKVFVGTNWTASSLAVGTTAGDDEFYGTSDDALIPDAGISPIVALVASVVVKGQTNGIGMIPGFHSGFVAEEFQSARFGNAVLPFTAAKDTFQLSAMADVILQER